jgi:hypothetical protein
MAALQDPAFVAEARTLDIPIAPMDGATLANEIDRVLSQPAATVELVSSIVRAGR